MKGQRSLDGAENVGLELDGALDGVVEAGQVVEVVVLVDLVGLGRVGGEARPEVAEGNDLALVRDRLQVVLVVVGGLEEGALKTEGMRLHALSILRRKLNL